MPDHSEWDGLHGREILIVDDEPLLAFDHSDELEARGALTTLAFSLGDAMTALSRAYPQLAVLDVNLGSDLVWPVAAALTARDIPFVLVTGFYIIGRIPIDVRPGGWFEKPVMAKVVADRLSQLSRPPA